SLYAFRDDGNARSRELARYNAGIREHAKRYEFSGDLGTQSIAWNKDECPLKPPIDLGGKHRLGFSSPRRQNYRCGLKFPANGEMRGDGMKGGDLGCS